MPKGDVFVQRTLPPPLAIADRVQRGVGVEVLGWGEVIVALTTSLVSFRPRSRGTGRGILLHQLPDGHSYLSLAVGDLSGDGVPEVCTAVRDPTGSVSVHCRLSPFFDQTFVVLEDAPLEFPGSMQLHDIDGDGVCDLVSPLHQGTAIIIFANTGYGLRPDEKSSPSAWLSTSVSLEAIDSTLSTPVHVGDVDGDGLLDILFPAGSSVQAFLNRGGRYFVETRIVPRLGFNPTHIRLADLSLDGYADIVVSDEQHQTVAWIEQQHAAFPVAVAESASVLLTPHCMGPWVQLFFDVDGDSIDDVVIVQSCGPTVLWMRGLGLGSLAPPEVLFRGDAPDAAVMDVPTVVLGRVLDSNATSLLLALRHDGSLLLQPNLPSKRSVTVAKGQRLVNISTCVFVNVSPSSSRPDALCAGGDAADPWIGYFENTGSAFASQLVELLDVPSRVEEIVVADFDRDLLDDIVVATRDHNVSVIFGHSHYRERVHVHQAAHPVVLAAADVDADGAPDLVVAERGASSEQSALPTTRWFSFDGDKITGTVVARMVVSAVRLVDLDRDGFVDVLCLSDGGLHVAYNTGHGLFAAPRLVLERDVFAKDPNSPFDIVYSRGEFDIISNVISGHLSRVALQHGNPEQVDLYVRSDRPLPQQLAAISAGVVSPGTRVNVHMAPGSYALSRPIVLHGYGARLFTLHVPTQSATLLCDVPESMASPCLRIVPGAGAGVRIVGGTLHVRNVDGKTRSGSLVLLTDARGNFVHTKTIGLWREPTTPAVYQRPVRFEDDLNAALVISGLVAYDTDVTCLMVSDSSAVRLHSVRITDCDTRADAGGAIIRDVGDVQLFEMEITSCRGQGGGLVLQRADKARLTSVVVAHSTAITDMTGMLALQRVDEFELSDVVVNDNSGVSCAGLYIRESEGLLRGINVTGNRASSLGGGVCVLQSKVNLQFVSVTRNHAQDSAGGMLVSGSTVDTHDPYALWSYDDPDRPQHAPLLVVAHNHVRGRGGGMYATSSQLRLLGASFAHNSAADPDTATGGAISIVSSSLSMTFSNITHNLSVKRGGAIHCTASAESDTASLYLGSCRLDQNSVLSGNGGALYLSDCMTTVQDSSVSHNTVFVSGSGGAVFLELSDDSKHLRLLSATVEYNKAADHGGAIALHCLTQPDVHSAFWITLQGRTTVRHNTAVGGGGGLLYWRPFSPNAHWFPVYVEVNDPAQLEPNEAVYGSSYASQAVSFEVHDASALQVQQSSRVPFKGNLVLSVRDFHGNIASSLVGQIARIGALGRQATLLGTGTQVSVVDGFLNFTMTGDLELEALPGASHELAVTPLFSFAMGPVAPFHVTLRNCTPGEFVEDQLRCVGCPRGRYTSTVAAPECLLCPLGRASAGERQSECAECPPGHFTPTRGATQCVPCGLGSSLSQAQAKTERTCRLCPLNSFAATEQSPTCQECVAPFFSNKAGSNDCSACSSTDYPACHVLDPSVRRCPLDEWGQLLRDGRIVIRCTKCPAHATCVSPASESRSRLNVSFRDIVRADDGHWVDFDAMGRASTFACRSDRVCRDGQCAPGRLGVDENPLCARCADGFYNWGGECVECEDDRVRWDVVIPLLLGTFLLTWAYHFLVQRTSSELPVLIYFGQSASLFVATTGLHTYVLQLVNTSVFSSAGSVCLAPLDPIQTALLGLASTAAILISWILLAASSFVARLWRHRSRSLRELRWSNWALPYWRTLLALYLLTFNSSVGTSLAFLHCTEVRFNGDRLQVVAAFPDVSCDSEGYTTAQPWILLLVVVELLLLPALFLWRIMAGLRRCAAGDEEDRFVRVWGVFFSVFRPSKFYWTFWGLGRRVALLCASVYLDHHQAARLSTWSLINVGVLFVHMIGKPFRTRNANIAEGFSLAMLCVLTLTLPMLGTDVSSQGEAVLALIVAVPGFALAAWVLASTAKRWRERRVGLGLASSFASNESELKLRSSVQELGEPLLGGE